MAGTKKPTGLKITRDVLKFTCEWKIADEDYGKGQQFQWRYNNGKWTGWTTVAIGSGTTAKAVSLSASNFYPTTKKYLYGIEFRVRGQRKPVTKDGKTTTYTMSDWSTKSFTLAVPNVPSLTQELDDELNNVTKFTWETTVSNSDGRHFQNTEWQTILVKESNVTDGSKLKWKTTALGWATGVSSRSSSRTITEDTVILARNSYTRWVRIRARGVRGVSAWRYAKHVYAMPYLPTINKAAKENTLNWIRVNWTAGANASHPIDITTVDWVIDTPRSGRAAPTDPSWTTARTFRDTGGADETKFLVDQAVGLDECLWVRVGVQHDRNWRATVAKLVVSGKLTAPTGLSVESDDTTHRATVSVTNNSDVPDSRIAVIFSQTGKKNVVVGIIPHGSSSITVQCPNWSGASAVSFGVYAFQGTETPKEGTGGVTTYAITANMKSTTLWDGGAVPVAPQNVSAAATETEGEVLLAWDWTWGDANRTEISWSQNVNAWESTNEPETYMITNLHVPQWRVSGLATGVTWYFCVRLAQETNGETTYGPYCDPIAVDLSSAPTTPVMVLSNSVVTEDGAITATWAYVTTDNTQQTYAEICEAEYEYETDAEDPTRIIIISEDVTYGSIVAHTNTAQHVSFPVPEEWETGSMHFLCVRVTSGSGRVSEWSNPVQIAVAEPIECNITQTSLQEITIGEGNEERTVTALTTMPLTATITGAGMGTTTLIVERAAEYHMDRPDETVYDGYAGETIVLHRQTGEDQITIDQDDLIGLLDDGAAYKLIAMTEDGLGQSATQEIDFEVHWSHQAVVPEATVTVDNENLIAVLEATEPEEYAAGDVCDIYRLSADRPVLIVENGEFDTEYVDPYPAIGDAAGYRFVYKTVNGDYITEDNLIAWLDIEGGINEDATIIDFGGNRVILRYDMEISHSWTKDFTETTYLGGAIQGDWNLSVHRSTSIGGDIVTDDAETITALRRLAAYTGICHVRTVDGSTFAADVQVSETRSHDTAGKIAAFNIAVTQVGTQTLDGMKYEEFITE